VAWTLQALSIKKDSDNALRIIGLESTEEAGILIERLFQQF